MSETSTPEERTEDPTERRMNQLRREGALHFSTEVVQVLTLFTGFLVVQHMCETLFSDLKLILLKCFKLIQHTEPFSIKMIEEGIVGMIVIIGPDLFLIAAVIGAAGSLAVLLQTNWNIKERKIHFRFLHINPLAGIKRIFSLPSYLNVLKALVKLSIILPIGYYALKEYAPRMVSLVHVGVNDTLVFTSDAMGSVFWKILYLLIPLAAADYLWGKRQWLKKNRMTKDEVKDERKSIEGDEATRRRIQAKGIQRIMQRIKNSVPKADVVVTNPTHYAVALQYDRATMKAPIVVAKGKGFLALRIREIARQHGVPVLERKTLARALYKSCEIGAQIPFELFRAVAEVLAYVYKLRGPRSSSSAQTNRTQTNEGART